MSFWKLWEARLLDDGDPLNCRGASAQHLDAASKDSYRPACTCIYERRLPRPGRILIGGHWAADDPEVLASCEVRAKICVAGTEGPPIMCSQQHARRGVSLTGRGDGSTG